MPQIVNRQYILGVVSWLFYDAGLYLWRKPGKVESGKNKLCFDLRDVGP